jgi:uncharacterized protein (DUF983 family)
MTASEISNIDHPRKVLHAIRNGIKCKCPNCGKGGLFNGFIKVKPDCASCGEELHHHRADDLPPYLNVFIVGHIIVGLLMISMNYELFGMWTTAIGGSVLAAIVAIAIMRPLKGMVIALQWAWGMHGFGTN